MYSRPVMSDPPSSLGGSHDSFKWSACTSLAWRFSGASGASNGTRKMWQHQRTVQTEKERAGGRHTRHLASRTKYRKMRIKNLRWKRLWKETFSHGEIWNWSRPKTGKV